MAALGTAINATTMATTILAEDIDAFLAGFNYDLTCADVIARKRPGVGSVPVRFQRLGVAAITAGTVTETDAMAANAITSAESSITPGIVGNMFFVSDQVVAGAVSGSIPADLLVGELQSIKERMDSDALAASTAATLTVGAITDVFTLDKLRAAKAYYRAQNITEGPEGSAMVLGATASTALEQSFGTAGSPFALSPADVTRFGTTHGYQGMLHGFQIFSSNNIPAETTGWSNFATPIGMMSGLGIVESDAPSIKQVAADYDSTSRNGTWYRVRAWFGAGIINPTQFVEILSA